MLFGEDGLLHSCSCPEVKAGTIAPVVWEAITGLLRNPDLIQRELSKRTEDKSDTKQFLERELLQCLSRLEAIPGERKRLVEGYRKGLYSDFMMREDMEAIQKEQTELGNRKDDLEKQLALRNITADQEARIKEFAKKMGNGLDMLDFRGRQELVRLLLDKVVFDGRDVEVQTIISPVDQLHPISQGDTGGEVDNISQEESFKEAKPL